MDRPPSSNITEMLMETREKWTGHVAGMREMRNEYKF
jgi:hypothetical protein